MAALVLVAAMLVSCMVFFQVPEALGAAPLTWQQTDWSDGTDTVNFPIQPTNQTGWMRFFSKDAGITAGADLTLTLTTASITHTTEADFGAGTLADTAVVRTDIPAEVRLAGVTSFSAINIIDSAFDGAYSVYAADLDGDGDQDVLGAAYVADDIA